MFCEKCGNQMTADMKFCMKCGHPVPAKKVDQSATQTLNLLDLPKDVWASFDVPNPPIVPTSAVNHGPSAAPAPKNEKKAVNKQVPKEFWQNYEPTNIPVKSSHTGKTQVKEYDDLRTQVGYDDISSYSTTAFRVNQQQEVAKNNEGLKGKQNIQIHNQIPDNAAQQKQPKKKGKTALIVISVALIIAILAGVTSVGVIGLINKKELDGDHIEYIEDFPVIKNETELTVFDVERFPAKEYEIKVERFLVGGTMKNLSTKSEVLKETSTAPSYHLNLSDGEYRITLTDIKAERTRPVTTTTKQEDKTVTTTTKAEEVETNGEVKIILVIIIDVTVDNNNPDALDKVNINSKPKSEKTHADGEGLSFPQTYMTLSAMDSDFRELEKIITDFSWSGLEEFDCKTATDEDIVTHYLTSTLLTEGYNYYFDDTERKNLKKEADPLNQWERDGADMDYLVLNGDNVKWICENIFHVRYNGSFNVGSDFVYAHEGNVYKLIPTTGDMGYDNVKVVSYSLSDDKYNIVLEATPDFDETVETFNITADLQNINGKRYWTFYSINCVSNTSATTTTTTKKRPEIEATKDDFDKLADILLALNFAEYDSMSATTAYAVEYMLTGEVASWGYSFFYKDIVNKPTVSDPLKRFGTEHKVMNASNVKWICENILNVKYDPSYSSEKSYIHNGKVYRKSLSATENVNYIATLTSYKEVDGRYDVRSEYYTAPIGHTTIDSTANLIGKFTIVAELKMIDGEKQWSIYSIKRM